MAGNKKYSGIPESHGRLNYPSEQDGPLAQHVPSHDKLLPPRKTYADEAPCNYSDIRDLWPESTILGGSERKEFDIISKYVTNSMHIPNVTKSLKLHQVWKFSGQQSKPKVKDTSLFAKSNNMFLWCETKRESWKRLLAQETQHGCTAFYDRISSALSIEPKTLVDVDGKSYRTVVLLCLVSLGKVYKCSQGVTFWRSSGANLRYIMPSGYNSVRGVGRLVPDPEQSCELDSALVPSGKSVAEVILPDYELDYNEYIVFDGNSVSPRYAVDVEIKYDKGNDTDSDFESYD